MTQPTDPSPEQPSQTPPSHPDPAPPGGVASFVSTSDETAKFDKADIDQNKVMAVLAYIMFLIPLLAAPKSPFARFHTNQGLNLFLCVVGGVIALIILAVLGGVAAMILPFLGVLFWGLSCLCYVALLVSAVALVILGIVNAANGQAKKLPVIGGLFNLIK